MVIIQFVRVYFRGIGEFPSCCAGLLESVGDCLYRAKFFHLCTLVHKYLSTFNDILKKVHVLLNWVLSVSCFFDQLYEVGPSCVWYA